MKFSMFIQPPRPKPRSTTGLPSPPTISLPSTFRKLAASIVPPVGTRVSDVDQPKPLAHERHVLRKTAPDARQRTPEVPPVRLAPVLQRPVALALFVGKPTIHLVEATHRNLRRLDDAERLVSAVEDHGLTPDTRHRLVPRLHLPEREARRGLAPGEDQGTQFVSQPGSVTERPGLVGLVARRAGRKRLQKRPPVRLDLSPAL